MCDDRSRHKGVVAIVANTGWYIFNFRRNLIRRLKSLGYGVAAICPTDEYVGRLQEIGTLCVPWKLDQTGVSPLTELRSILLLRAALKSIRATAVVSFTPKGNIYSGLASRGLETEVVPNISGLGRAFSSDGIAGYVFRRLYRLALRGAGVVFFQNDEDRVEFVSRSVVRAEAAERVMGSGVDLDRFIVCDLPCSLQKGGRTTTFLLMARLLREKGVYEYVNAARVIRKRCREARFLLLGPFDEGRGISKGEVEDWRQEDVIEYLGVHDDVTHAIASADCIVLPSYYREGVPRSLIEGAAMGRACITTNMPGCRDVVEHGKTGWICEPRDSTELTARMMDFVSLDNEERVAMGLRARKRVEALFDERTIIDRYVRIIDQLHGQGRHRSSG